MNPQSRDRQKGPIYNNDARQDTQETLTVEIRSDIGSDNEELYKHFDAKQRSIYNTVGDVRAATEFQKYVKNKPSRKPVPESYRPSFEEQQ